MIKKAFLLSVLFCLSSNIFCQKLLDAVGAKNYVEVKALLEKGENPKKYGQNGIFPLWEACFVGDTAIVRLLIKFKADVNQQTKNKNPSSSLHACTQEGHLDVVKILVENGVDVNRLGIANQSAIRVATRNGHLEIIKYLIVHGANFDDKSADDRATPLESAAGKGHLEIVKFLVEKGANVNHQDKELDTPIGEAANKGFVEVVKYLLSKGANPLLKNDKGYDAIYRAKIAGQSQIAKLMADFVEKK
jgi:uncharacterized protein